MLVSYVAAYVLCSAAQCQLVIPDSALRYASQAECETSAPRDVPAASRPGSLSTMVCVAVPEGGAPPAGQAATTRPRTPPPAASAQNGAQNGARNDAGPTAPPDPETESLNRREIELLDIMNGKR